MVSFIFRKKRYTVSFFVHLWDNKEHKSVIVSFPYQKEYTIADKEVVADEGIHCRKLILEYIQMRKRPAS